MDTPPEVANLTLEDLLPHRGRMLLIDEVLAVDRNHAVTRSVVDVKWPMVTNGAADSLICIELAAQTAGVCNGWDRILTHGRDSDQQGWLVGIKKADFSIERLPIGTTIIGRAENTYSFENLREVSCELRIGETVIAGAILQLFRA